MSLSSATQTKLELVYEEFENMVMNNDEKDNMKSIEILMKIFKSIPSSEFQSKSFDDTFTKIYDIYRMLGKRSKKIQSEFLKIMDVIFTEVMSQSEPPKKPKEPEKPNEQKKTLRKRSVSIYEKPVSKKEINKDISQIIQVLKEREKKKDIEETQALRRSSTEKEKQRLSRFKTSRINSLKKYLASVREKPIQIESMVYRK